MIEKLNIFLFNFINHFAGKNILFDDFMVILAGYLPFIFIFLLIGLWFRNIKYRNLVLYSGYSAILGLLLNYIITLFYFHPRPFMENIGIALIKHSPETSFPSDHTTFLLSIAFMFLYFKKTRKMGVILSLLGLIGGISRIYCGVHFPWDIFGSILVALVSSYLIFLLKGRFQQVNRLIIGNYDSLLRYLIKILNKIKLK